LSKFCTECGTKVSDSGQTFCLECGAPVRTGNSPEQREDQSEPELAEPNNTGTPSAKVEEIHDVQENALAGEKQASLVLLVLSAAGALIMAFLVVPFLLAFWDFETPTVVGLAVMSFLIFLVFFQWWKFHHYKVAELQTRALIQALSGPRNDEER